MIFSEQDRKTLEAIWERLSRLTTTMPLPPPAPDLRPLLNELGQQLGRVEAKQREYDKEAAERMQYIEKTQAEIAKQIALLAKEKEDRTEWTDNQLATMEEKLDALAERLGAIERKLDDETLVAEANMGDKKALFYKHKTIILKQPVRNGAKGRGKKK